MLILFLNCRGHDCFLWSYYQVEALHRSQFLESLIKREIYWCIQNADFSSVQSFSHVWLFAAPWTAACQPSLSITNSRSLLKLMFIESVVPSNHLILCNPLLLLPSIFPNNRVFSNESALCIRWPNYWSFSIGPSNEYSGLISFRIDWFDFIAVQGSQESSPTPQLKASILWCLAFFMVQFSHPYMTTENIIALTIRTFVSKVMSLLLNTLSRFVIALLPRSKCLLISWL